MASHAAPARIGLMRRLAAGFYDSLLVLALLFPATALLLPFNHGQGIPAHGFANTVYRLYILAIGFLFFGWFWTHGGQTLGMRVWRLRVVRADGRLFTWRDALARYLALLLSLALGGLGILWILVDRERLAWHDRLSGTRLELTPPVGSRSADARDRKPADQSQD